MPPKKVTSTPNKPPELGTWNLATRRNNPNIYRENNAPSSKTPQPTRLTPNNWRKEKQKVYALFVIASIVRDISVVRRNYST